MIDLDELQKLAEAATPGEWAWASAPAEDSDETPAEYLASALTGDGPLFVVWVPATEGDPDGYLLTAATGDGPHASMDAEYIAAANPATVLELIERVRRANRAHSTVAKLYGNATDERDAALAAVERIRQAVSGHPECDRYEDGDVISCGWKSAYASVVAALDGAPEPEWEYQCTNNINTTELLADPELHAKRCSGKIERRRKAGPWEPVEGEN